MSDIMDEFEFKPLTEGLGFHKKIQEKTSELKINAEKHSAQSSLDTNRNSSMSSSMNSSMGMGSMGNSMDSIMESSGSNLEKTGNSGKSRIPDLHSAQPSAQQSALHSPLHSPLPRPERPEQKRSEPKKQSGESIFPSTTVDEILKTLQDKKRPQFAPENARARIDMAPEPVRFNTSVWDMSAFMLDFMLVLASNLMCLIILLFTTHVDLFSNLYNPDSSGMIYLSLATLFLGTSWIYMVANRIFLGCTPGEWVFDQRIGLPEETGSAMYCLKIVLRSTIIVLSGMILFPLASALMNRDILGRWLGLEMLKKA